MSSDRLSGRQLSVAALVGGLSHGAVFAGVTDWRWLLAGVPLAALVGWLLLRKARKGLFRGRSGWVLAVCYWGWSAAMLSCVLQRTAQRLQQTNGSPGDGVWILVLMVLPLLRMAWGRSAPFFRMVEIFWLAAVVLLAGLMLFSVPRVEWRWLVSPMGGWRQSLPGVVVTLSPLLFTLPYIYKVEGAVGWSWQAGLAGAVAALSAIAAGILSPAVAGQLPNSFFIASGVLGESVRAEGLVSALWLLPDLTLAGLLSRSWGGRFGPICAVGLAALVALTGISNYFSPLVLALGTAALAFLTLVFPEGKGKIVVSFW